MKDLTKEPIRNISEWENSLFPPDGDYKLSDDTDTSPARLAEKWVRRAIESLRSEPVK